VSLAAMTNLMCRGRKRGLAGIVATQRLAKLAKNVAAEASNFLMGRTFLDIDMARAADLLGMDRRQAERFRDLEPGHFVALGPALSRRPVPIRIGTVETAGRTGRPTLMARPEMTPEDMADLIFKGGGEVAPMPVARAPMPTRDLLERVAAPKAGTEEDADPRSPDARQALVEDIFAEMLADPEAAFRPVPILYQDFLVHCRLKRLGGAETSMPAFRRRLSLARAGVSEDTDDEDWRVVIQRSEALPEEMQGVYLMLARAARDGEECPTDEALARAYGSHSPSRGRFLLGFMAERGFITAEADFRGNRVVTIAGTPWRASQRGNAPTPPAAPSPLDEARLRRAARLSGR
jgi:hypothetical protein